MQSFNQFKKLISSVNGKVKHGSVKEVANMYSVSTRTVSRIWKKGIACVANGVQVDVSLNLSGNVGRKRIAINPEDVARIPLNRRTTIRSMASALSMSKTSLHRRVKDGSLKSHSNAVKPMLTVENRKVRLQFCISMIDSSSSHNNPCFIDMYDRVHIDEKWFSSQELLKNIIYCLRKMNHIVLVKVKSL
nr:Transposase, Tc1-like protein [Ipomoea batatas]